MGALPLEPKIPLLIRVPLAVGSNLRGVPNTEFSMDNDIAHPRTGSLTAEQRSALRALAESVRPASDELGDRFDGCGQQLALVGGPVRDALLGRPSHDVDLDRKSTRLNSSHVSISYAVFCLKKKKKNN